MEYLDVIKTRRSIRTYQEKLIPKELLFSILQEAILAPSAHNRQPWRFLILEGPQKNFIAHTMEEKDAKTKKTAQAMRESSHLILVFNAETGHHLEDLISIGGMIEQLCLSATAHGIGTLWMTYPLIIEQEIKDYVSVSYDLVSVLALGYSKEGPSPCPRKDLEEVLLAYLHE